MQSGPNEVGMQLRLKLRRRSGHKRCGRGVNCRACLCGASGWDEVGTHVRLMHVSSKRQAALLGQCKNGQRSNSGASHVSEAGA